VTATIPCADEPAWTTGGRSERIGSVRKLNTLGDFSRLPPVGESSLEVRAALTVSARWLFGTA